MSGERFIQVILPLRLSWEPFYRCPGGSAPAPGTRVRVNFAGKEYVGVVSAAREEAVDADGMPVKGVKPVEGLAEGLDPVTEEEIELWRQVADYYLCTVGEVYKAAYPAGRVSRELSKPKKKKRKPAPGEASAGGEIQLSEAQRQAYSGITGIFKERKPVLLHGVTGSGKTEIYLKLAEETLARGKNVLYLVPEIALGKQLEDRLEGIFPKELLVCHSGETMARRREVAAAIRNGPDGSAGSGTEAGGKAAAGVGPGKTAADAGSEKAAADEGGHENTAAVAGPDKASGRGWYLALGTRSALFLPHRNLGLVIVDEEHDSSYKQDSPAPRYNGRDTAIMLAGIHRADVLLGSATPSLESLYNCSAGRFGHVSLTKRYFDAADSDVELIDTIAERRKNGMVGSFSRKLIERIGGCLGRHEQVVLLRERRAFSPVVQCKECGHIPKCSRCNVTLSLHKRADGSGKLVCHYCGRVREYAGTCPECGGVLVPMGAGTQKIEEEVQQLFPEARIERLDSDSAQNRRYETEVIRRFAKGEVDILIGTRIIAKGFDFSGLKLVAVLQADSILGLQDFRADERGFQLLEQFRGRCGRRGEKGLFVVQTSQPDHPVYKELCGEITNKDLQADLLEQRKDFCYPPYSRVVGVTVKDWNLSRIELMSRGLGAVLRAEVSGAAAVEGPCAPAIDKVSGRHIRHLRVMLRKDRTLKGCKAALAAAVERFEKDRRYAGHIALDVDPV